MKINRYIILGIIFLILSVLIFFCDFFDIFIRPFTQIILMGSSKGKDILFFGIFGLFLILNQILEYNSYSKKCSFLNKSLVNKSIENETNSKSAKRIYLIKNILKKLNKLKNNNKLFLKITIILFLSTGIFGLILEIFMRLNLGINVFTVFISMFPEPTSSSIIHSHIFKSVTGSIITSTIQNVPNGIHTGDSLYKYVPNMANIIILILPITLITMLISLKNRTIISKLILIFAFTCGLIGIIDGGFFATPYIIGLIGIILIYFDEKYVNHYLFRVLKLDFTNSEDNRQFFKCEKLKNHVKIHFKRSMPWIILVFVLVLRISVSILGTNPEYYEVTLLNPTYNAEYLKTELDSYSIISIEESNDKILIKIIPNYNELSLLNKITHNLDGKCDILTMTWNFYSYF